MKNACPPFRSISCFFLLCLSFFSFFCLPDSIFAQCLCSSSTPTDCSKQSIGPCSTPAAFTYILRYSVVGEHGAMTFIGNTLGLNKGSCVNDTGTSPNIYDSIGTFITVDNTKQVGSYANISASDPGGPAGTTLDWTLNSSSADLNLSGTPLILYAELIWSGSYGYFCGNNPGGVGVDVNCVLDNANKPVYFTTPDGIKHQIQPDSTTALVSQNTSPTVRPYFCAGNYVRSQNVTSILTTLFTSQGTYNGTYTVGHVPATISPFENNSNAAGWTLAIIYRDISSTAVYNMSLFVGAQQSTRSTDPQIPAVVSGFCVPKDSAPPAGRILVSAIEGDANKMDDHLLFGSTLPLTNANSLFGDNNPSDNFFCSQINDDMGHLITTGTFGPYNSTPWADSLKPLLTLSGRQGYDITNVDCSPLLSHGQTIAYTLGTTSGDDYMINALGIQIGVDAPVIDITKLVDNEYSTVANIGEIVTFSFSIDNTGTEDAYSLIFTDILESGLMFVPGSVLVNGFAAPNADPAIGITLGNLLMKGPSITVEFQAQIVSPPPSGNEFVNRGNVSFNYYPACGGLTTATTQSNPVYITLFSVYLPPPNSFSGVAKKCQFLNKTMYNLQVTWDSPDVTTAVEYQIFKNGILQATIPATDSSVFQLCLDSKKQGSEVTIVAVYPNNFVSAPITPEITYE